MGCITKADSVTSSASNQKQVLCKNVTSGFMIGVKPVIPKSSYLINSK